MKINIKEIGVNLSSTLKEYIKKKVGSLAKFLKRFEKEGEVTATVEVERTTRHHRHGEIYRTAVDIQLPKGDVRAEQEGESLLATIEIAKDKAKTDVKKYKEKDVQKKTERTRAAKRPGK